MENIFSIFKNKLYILLFILVSLFFVSLFIFIPVFTVVGNDLSTQLSTFTIDEYLLMLFLALSIGFNFVVQIYIIKNKKSCSTGATTANSTLSSIAGVFGAIIGTAFCPSCLLPLFAIVGLGSGSVFFIFEHQVYFVFASIVFMIVILYFSIRKFNKFIIDQTMSIKTQSTLTCPKCNFQEKLTMPTDSCQFFHECSQCKARLKPKDGDCCVFCSYGDTKCPSKQ